MASNAAPTLPPYLQEQLAHISDDRRSVWVISAAVCLSLSLIAVILRFVARHYSAMRYGMDDIAILIATLVGIAYIVDTYLGALFGGGRHFVLLLLDQGGTLTSYGKNTVANECLYNPTLLAIKISILLLYGRIFPNKNFHKGLWAVGAFTTAYTLCAIVVALAQCKPLESLWTIGLTGTCINFTTALTVFGALNVVTDVVILLMPIPMVWQLHTNWTAKAQITGLFLTGALVTVISIARVVYVSYIDPQDPTWTQTDGAAWTMAEVATAIISACLPTYRPLFDKSKRKSHRSGEQHTWTSKSKSTYSKTAGGIGDDAEPLKQIRIQTDIRQLHGEQDE